MESWLFLNVGVALVLPAIATLMVSIMASEGRLEFGRLMLDLQLCLYCTALIASTRYDIGVLDRQVDRVFISQSEERSDGGEPSPMLLDGEEYTATELGYIAESCDTASECLLWPFAWVLIGYGIQLAASRLERSDFQKLLCGIASVSGLVLTVGMIVWMRHILGLFS